MGRVQKSNRRGADSSDALTIGNVAVAPGKQPRTAALPVQRKGETDAEPAAAADRGAADQISTQDVQYEIIAHKIGYETSIGDVEGQLLRQWGYRDQWAARINDGATGFFAGLIMPDEAHSGQLTPILVFRGTEGFRDIVSDIHPVAVGHDQFQPNRRFVQQLIAEAGGRVDVTGHSLGGALAQHAAAAFTGSINRVVTFQAPGIDAASAARFANAEDGPEVTHHIAGGDLVDTAGDAHLEGEVFRHTPGGGPTSHTKFLLSTPEFAAQREQLGLTDEVLAQLQIARQTNQRPVERYEEYPHPVKSAIDETVRRGAGTLLYPILNGVSVLTRNDDADLRSQIEQAGEASIAGYPISERAYMIDRLCRGVTGDEDEEAILTVLRASASAGDAAGVIDLVGAYLIAENLHGSQYRDLRTFYRASYYRQTSQSNALALLQRCIDGRTAEWEEEMIADILVDRSDGRALITRIGAVYKGGGFSEGLDEIQWQLDGGDQRRVDAQYA